MKHTLKGWLVDNAVTVDNKEDKILMLESAGSLTLEDILSEMKKEDTGLREETIEHAVKLYHRVLSDLMLSGYSVNTGLFRAVPQFRGVVDGGQWDQKRIQSTSPLPRTRTCAKLLRRLQSTSWEKNGTPCI